VLEQPAINLSKRTGYSVGIHNMVNQPEHCGIDYFGDEILEGDSVVEIGNDTVLEDNLEDYLIEVLGAKFFTAK
jgi:hypothetical protein